MAILDELIAVLGFDFRGRRDADEYRRTLNGVDRQLEGVGRRAVGFGRLITAAIVTLGGAKIIGAAVSFEEAMADINKVVDATPDQIASLSDEFLKMSRELPVSAEGLAAIAAEAGAAGVAFDDLPGFARQVALAVTAFDLPAEQVGETMSKLATVFGFNIEQMGFFNDTVNHLSNNMAAKAGEILNFTNRAAGAATFLNLTAEQLAGAGAALIAVGVVPETAARGFNALGNRIQNDANGVSEALALVGMTTQQLQSDLAIDGDGSLVKLFASLSDLDTRDQAEALTGLLGMDFSDDFSKLLSSPDTLAQAIAAANDETVNGVSLQDEFNARAATTAAKWQRVKNILTSVGIVLAGPLLDGFQRVADFVFTIVSAFDQAGGGAEGLAAAMQTIGLPVDVADINEFATQVVNAFEVIKSAVTGFVQVWVGRLQEFMATESFQETVAQFAEAGSRLGEIWAKLQEILASEGGQEMIRIIKEVTDALFELWAQIITSGIALAFDNLTTAILGLLTAFGQIINGDFQGAMQTLIDTFGNLKENIEEALVKLSEFVGQFATDLGAAIGDGIIAGVNTAIQFINDQLDALVQGIKDTLSSLNPLSSEPTSPEDLQNIRDRAAAGEFSAQPSQSGRNENGLTPVEQTLANMEAALETGAAAASTVANLETGAAAAVEQTLNTDNTRNITQNVTNNTTVNQTVTGATAPEEAARATNAAVKRGTDRALTVNNSGADS